MSMFKAASRPAGLDGGPMPHEAAEGPGTPSGAGAPGAPVRPVDGPASDAPGPPDGGMAGLLVQAMAARARLGDQPLPIANRDTAFVTTLLGG